MTETEPLRPMVIAVVADVLGVTEDAVSRADDLTEFPTYSSFRVLDIVETVEQRLGVEVDPADLVPSRLRRIDSLCAVFARALPPQPDEERVNA